MKPKLQVHIPLHWIKDQSESFSINQHQPASISISQHEHQSESIGINQHQSACISIRQHQSASICFNHHQHQSELNSKNQHKKSSIIVNLLVCLHRKPNIHTRCIFVTSLHSVQSHGSSKKLHNLITLVAFVRLHSIMLILHVVRF